MSLKLITFDYSTTFEFKMNLVIIRRGAKMTLRMITKESSFHYIAED